MTETKDSETTTVTLKVGLHCDKCTRKVQKQIFMLRGVEELKVDRKDQQVIVKGKKLDPKKLLDELHHIGKEAQIVKVTTEPKPKAKEEEPKKKEEPKPPPIQTTVLKVDLHCKGCADKVGSRLLHTPGVQEVKVELNENKVTVKGIAEPKKVLEAVQQTGKAAELWPQKKEEKKKEEKKQEEKKEEKKVEKKDEMHYKIIEPSENPNGCVFM